MSRRVAKVKSNGELKHYRRYYSPLETPPDIPVGWRGVRKELPNGWFVDRIPNTGDDAPRNRTWRLIGGGNDTYPNWRYARHFANEIFLAMPLLPATSGGGSSLSHNQAYELGMIDEYGNWLVTDPSDISSSYDSYVEAKSGIFLSASTTEIQNLMKTKYFLLTWNNKPGNESFNGNDGVIKSASGSNYVLRNAKIKNTTSSSPSIGIYIDSGSSTTDQTIELENLIIITGTDSIDYSIFRDGMTTGIEIKNLGLFVKKDKNSLVSFTIGTSTNFKYIVSPDIT